MTNLLTIVCGFAIIVSLVSFNAATARPTPTGTAFAYQGQLKQGGNNVNATADFEFRLFDVPTGGTIIGSMVPGNNVTITEGLFTVELDFGAGAFGTEARWLDISVRSPAGSGAFAPLSPRQRITPAPVAQFALAADGPNLTNLNASNITSGTLPSAQLSGNYSGAVNFSNSSNVFFGSGGGLSNLNAGSINAGTLAIGNGGTGASTSASALSNLNAQARVIGSAPVGSYIRAINVDGTVVTGVDVDTNTTYSAGQGLALSGTTFSLAQQGAASGQVLKWNGSGWVPSVDIDTNTTYAAGTGLVLAGTVFSLNLSSSNTWTGAQTFSSVSNSFTGTGAGLTTLNASNISSGNLAVGRLPTGGNWALSSSLTIDTSTLQIDPTANQVGIGGFPSAKLHVAEGAAGVAPHSNAGLAVERSGNNYINVLAPDANETGILFGNPTSGATAGGVLFNSAANTGGLQFRTNTNDTQMTITAAGNVGIGAPNPTAKLEIGGVAGTDGIKFPDGSVQVKAAITLRLVTSTFPVQALAPGASTSYGFSVSGATVGSVVVVSPLSDLGSGLMIGPARVSSAGLVSFYVHNVSNSATAATSTQFSIAVIP